LGDCSPLFERIDVIERVVARTLRSGYGCNAIGVIVIVVIIVIIVVVIGVRVGVRVGGASVRVGGASVRGRGI
jgi:hypothetical protein